jgi:hypothetical protein
MSSGNPNGKVFDEAAEAVGKLQALVAQQQARIVLLDEENAALAAQLRKLGVDVRRASHHAYELPAATHEPLVGTSETMALMTGPEQTLLATVCGRDTVLMAVHTGTTVDAGGWIRRTRVWAVATATDLVLIAAGRRPLIQKTAYEHIRASIYNHVTGELILAPNRKFRVSQIKVHPAEGFQLLAQICDGNTLESQ